MRLSDYIIQYLEKLNVDHIFMLSGGGIMYLVDALGRSSIDYVCCHHEQAAGIAAQAYAMKKNSLGVCMVTTGPGGTNALTAAGAAYMDSTPVLFITGQVKTADFASLRNVRQFGAQENDIVSMASPVTKYAITVSDPGKIRYHLEKAVYLAMHGRRGPVWLDIPLDVQNADIIPESLEAFNAAEIEERDVSAEINPDKKKIQDIITRTIGLLKSSKRPVLLLGHGLTASGGADVFYEIQKKIKVPIISTWRALDIMDYEDPYFFGSPGLQAARYSNLIVQGADLLIVLGSRLDNMITAFNEEHFAFRAQQRIIVDIDENEILKLNMQNVIPAVCSVKYFLDCLDDGLSNIELPEYQEWLAFCREMKDRFPLLQEKQQVLTDSVDLYQVSMKVSERCDANDTIVVSSTSRCNTAGHMAFKHKRGQSVVSSMAFGSMGFALPSVIGCWFANNKQRIVMLEGDGSLQLNIQELQTIVHHNVNVKMFVFHNAGYAAIATMQDRNFDGFHVGCDAESGVTLPDLKKIAEAYGITYYCISDKEEIDTIVSRVMSMDGAVICEFIGSITFDEIPKCISNIDESGNRVSASLENPFPFLSEQEMEDIYKGL